jgi:hypothetical protein
MTRIQERLQQIQRLQMVGRVREIALCHDLLQSNEHLILHFYGPGGIGKTTVLEAFRDSCLAQNIAVAHLDGRYIEATPEAFSQAVAASNKHQNKQVILIDTFERLRSLENWLRDFYLPTLPDNTRLIFCGRVPLGDAWRSDAGWHGLIKEIALKNLTSEETTDFLNARAIPLEHHPQFFSFTHGYPLALSLMADVCAQSGTQGGTQSSNQGGTQSSNQGGSIPLESPDMLQTLLRRFVDDIPSNAHREALEICALFRITTESVLTALLLQHPVAFIHDLFTWLASVSFMERSPLGISPHDLAREAILADLRWRHPVRLTTLNRQARAYFIRRFSEASPAEQPHLIQDYIFLHKDNPIIRAAFTWDDTYNTESVQPADISQLRQMVARHEGEASAQLFDLWATHPAHQAVVFQESFGGEPQGFLSFLDIAKVNHTDAQVDPAVQSALAYLKEQDVKLGPEETVMYFRFWMTNDSYQAVSPLQSQIIVQCVRYYLMNNNLAFSFFPCSDPDFWHLAFTYADIQRLPEADFDMGGHTYGVYGHNWQQTPAMDWLTLLSTREDGLGPAQFLSETGTPTLTISYRTIDSETFEKAVRDALKHFTDPDELFGNALLESRLMSERVTAEAHWQERSIALQTLLAETMATLEKHPKQARAYRALYKTFIHPEPTQEKAAEMLDLPFSTYRRHLNEGIDYVVRTLWHKASE